MATSKNPPQGRKGGSLPTQATKVTHTSKPGYSDDIIKGAKAVGRAATSPAKLKANTTIQGPPVNQAKAMRAGMTGAAAKNATKQAKAVPGNSATHYSPRVRGQSRDQAKS